MSHVVNIDIQIRSLSALKQAAKALGLEFREGQRQYRWFGRHVGDYPLPAGFRKEDMGKCDHAISIPNAPSAYEVGVCARRDGKPGYLLQFDFFAGGNGLMKSIGEGANKLRDEYAAAVAIQKVRAKGFRVTRTVTEAGKIVLRAVR